MSEQDAGAEALEYAAKAVATTLDMLDGDAMSTEASEVYRMLAQVLRHPEVMA